MNRLIGGVLVAALFAVGCSAGTGGTTPTNRLGGATTNPQVSAAVGDAKAQLCDPSNDASLSSLSTRLAAVTPNTDTSTLQTALGVAETNLDQVQVTAEQQVLKQAAQSALQSVQAGLDRPTTVAETAAQAATALTALNSSLCV